MDIKEKSFIERSYNITANRTVGMARVKFLNKKGTFRKTPQCEACKFKGMAVVALGGYREITCDRDMTTWRRLSGSTDKSCKFAQVQEEQL
ncbi:hypothetical protein [Sporomusa malonica]|uniref:Uncharacterized protein n=1 Tax=Sporomusa malonica TaxID=112901 RepID=A0A1W2ATX8_9FIRM|nr:hypothetical protein [Sporomusa malonica]SMC63891.1 hypothetical protein SAMN04488500_10697 [Sporomusa malonica]